MLKRNSLVLPNLQFGRREYQHLQCGKTTISGCRGTTALQPNGGVVGLSHRGSRRINGKLTASKCFAFSVANLRFRGGFMVIRVGCVWRNMTAGIWIWNVFRGKKCVFRAPNALAYPTIIRKFAASKQVVRQHNDSKYLNPMKRILLILVLICSLFSVYAQDVEQNRNIMTMVQAASDRYLSASGSADALDLATSRAVSSLSNQISQYVANTGRGVDDEVAHEVARTFSDTQLSDYQFLVVKKPQGDDKDYTVFVFIGKARVDEIVAEIKETVQEANSARAKQADADLRFYYAEACRAIKDYRIGDALKYLYWSYVISLDTQAVLEEEGRAQPATVLIEAKIERLLKNINISVVSFTKEKINDFQERYKAVLNIEYVQDGIAHKVTNLD